MSQVKKLEDICLKYIVSEIELFPSFRALPADLLVAILDAIKLANKLNTKAFNKLVGPNLTSISLSYVGSLETDLHIAHSALHRIPYEIENLQLLSLPHHHKIDEQTIKLILQRCSNLQILTLRGMEDLNDICFITEPNPVTCTSLREIDLLGCKNITGRSLVVLSQHAFHNLEKLCIKGCYQFMESTITALLSNCIGKKLRKLVLADCENVSDITISTIADNCPLLNYLDLSWCDAVTDNAFINMVHQVPLLQYIRLRKTQLTDKSIQAIASTYNTNLLKLDICLCDQITNNAIVYIYENCTQLERLYLSWITSCTNEDVENILFKCSFLKILKLEGCKNITFQALECLAYESETRPACALTLKQLDLRWCNHIQYEMLSSLRNTCPGIEILDYYGQTIIM